MVLSGLSKGCVFSPSNASNDDALNKGEWVLSAESVRLIKVSPPSPQIYLKNLKNFKKARGFKVNVRDLQKLEKSQT